MNTAAAAPALPLPVAPPVGFTAEDICPNCDGRTATLTDAVDEHGEFLQVEDGEPVLALADCDDCDGVGYVHDEPVTETPAERLAQRTAAHDEWVAEHGQGASCSSWATWCRHR